MLVGSPQFQSFNKRSFCFLSFCGCLMNSQRQQSKWSLQSWRHFLFKGSISFKFNPSKDSTTLSFDHQHFHSGQCSQISHSGCLCVFSILSFLRGLHILLAL